MSQHPALGPVALGPRERHHTAQAQDEQHGRRDHGILEIGPAGGLDGGDVEANEDVEGGPQQIPRRTRGVAIIGTQKIPGLFVAPIPARSGATAKAVPHAGMGKTSAPGGHEVAVDHE